MQMSVATQNQPECDAHASPERFVLSCLVFDCIDVAVQHLVSAEGV